MGPGRRLIVSAKSTFVPKCSKAVQRAASLVALRTGVQVKLEAVGKDLGVLMKGIAQVSTTSIADRAGR